MGYQTFYCSCGQDFDERPLLEIHKQKCPTIEEIFKEEEAQNNELKENKPPIVDQFKCDKCDKVFSTKKYLRQHQRNVHPKQHQLNQFECDKCDRAFNSYMRLANHKYNVHPKCLHMCDKCDKVFSTSKYLQQHNRNVHPKQFKCDKCDRAFNSHKNLSTHISHVHPKYLHTCGTCGNTFKTKGTLKRLAVKLLKPKAL